MTGKEIGINWARRFWVWQGISGIPTSTKLCLKGRTAKIAWADLQQQERWTTPWIKRGGVGRVAASRAKHLHYTLQGISDVDKASFGWEFLGDFFGHPG